MVKYNHTPGEWSIEMYPKSPNGGYAMVWAEGLERDGCQANPDVCKVYSMGKGELEANARLIAASPDLLAALLLCVEDYEAKGGLRKEGTPSHIMAARAAISRMED